MTTHLLYRKSTLAILRANPDPRDGSPARWTLPDGQTPPAPADPDLGYAVEDLAALPFDAETQTSEVKIHERDGIVTYGPVVRDLTEEEITARLPQPAQLLAQARADMAGVILALPALSRAKFSSSWAGGNTLLDSGDVEGCHALVNAIVTDTPEEDTAKQTILSALINFLP